MNVVDVNVTTRNKIRDNEFTRKPNHNKRDLDIDKQMLETSYILNLGQLFKIALRLNKYFWQKLKPKKTLNLNKATTEK